MQKMRIPKTYTNRNAVTSTVECHMKQLNWKSVIKLANWNCDIIQSTYNNHRIITKMPLKCIINE